VLLLALSAAGCATLPDEGPVRVDEAPDPTTTSAPFDFNPPGPVSGATQDQVVSGFLRALQATPASTAAAQEFLTADAAAAWRPDRSTVVYDGVRTRSSARSVTVLFDSAFRLDSHGRWRGPAAEQERAFPVAFPLAREDGEWRISEPPDATLIPRSHFAARYRSYLLYFADPSGSVLVPEPVYLPWGPQAPTELVSGLIAGPPRGARRTLRSFIPRGTRLEVSVPVDDDGVARVPLTAEIQDLDERERGLVMAQLTWTLRQVAEVRRVGVVVGNAPLEIGPGGTTVSVTEWQEYDPSLAAASTDLFGLRGTTVVQVVGDEEIVAADLAEAGVGRAGALAVDVTGQQFAVVSADRREVAVVSRSPGSRVRATYAGGRLLRPAWDRTDRLWLLDGSEAGPMVRVVEGRRTTALPAPGARGTLLAGTLSRDGTRLALVVRRGREPVLLLARVVRDAAGSPVRLTRAVRLGVPARLRNLRGLGWRDPVTLAVLTRPSETTSEVVLASADGSSATVGREIVADTLFDQGTAIAASPGGPRRLLVTTRAGRVHELDLTGRWDLDALEALEGRLRAATFVG
jgi:hypothetical protein